MKGICPNCNHTMYRVSAGGSTRFKRTKGNTGFAYLHCRNCNTRLDKEYGTVLTVKGGSLPRGA